MKTRMRWLMGTMALGAVVAVGIAYAGAPNGDHGSGSEACKQAHANGQCQHEPGKCSHAHGAAGQAAKAAQFQTRLDTIEGMRFELTNTDSGVIIKVTAEKPESVKLIQAHFARVRERWMAPTGLQAKAASGTGPARVMLAAFNTDADAENAAAVPGTTVSGDRKCGQKCRKDCPQDCPKDCPKEDCSKKCQ